MRIRTQFILSTIIFGLILIVIAGELIVTNQRLRVISQQEEITLNLQQEANELGSLADDYLIYQEDQQLTRWEAKFASFSSDLTKLNPGTPEQQVLVRNLQSNQQQLAAVFADVKATLEKNVPGQGAGLDPVFIRTFWSRMEVQSQGMIFSTTLLNQSLSGQEDRLKQNVSWLIYFLVGLFGAFVLGNYFLNYRRTIKAIAVLHSGAKVIGSGNLDYTIPEKGKDEISDLSRAFNRMSASLKTVTASKADLENEIEERKKVEDELKNNNAELKVANKELEAFSYSVSHDLRTPLRALEGFSELLINDYGDKLDETGKDYLNRIRKASQNMAQITEDILKLSRVTRVEMHRDEVNLSALAESIAGELKATQPKRRVEFIIAPQIMVNCDQHLMEIFLRNLLENSWKYTGKCPDARIELGANLQDGKMVYFIKDNGIGFDMKYSNKLFQPFQRLHTSKDYSGTGIGLATVQRIIHRHSGNIWAYSEMGKGTTFYFTLE